MGNRNAESTAVILIKIQNGGRQYENGMWAVLETFSSEGSIFTKQILIVRKAKRFLSALLNSVISVGGS